LDGKFSNSINFLIKPLNIQITKITMNIRIARKPRLWFIKPFPTNFKKRSLFQKSKSWVKSFKKPCYKMDGQIAMW